MAKFGQDSVECSFCGKPQDAVAKLIAGTGVYICNECVNLCVDIIEGLDTDQPRTGTTTRTPPTAQSVPGRQPGRRVQLHYDRGDDRLVGTVGEEPLEWQLARWNSVAGHMGSAALEASWTTGDNYVPEPGGWTPSPDYVSDFPNIPADLSGSYDGLQVELHGVFHISDDHQFERGSVVGTSGK